MLKLALYLSRKFLFTWLGVVFVFVTLITLLDSLANGGDIIAAGGSFTDSFKYMFYRAPVIFDRIFVFTLLVAILLVYMTLIRGHELVALLGFGLSASRQVFLLAPAVILATCLSIFTINQFMPPAVQALQAWGVGEYRVRAVSQDRPLWLEDKSRIVRIAVRPGMTELAELEMFMRDDKGIVTDALWADTANYDNGQWNLLGVQTLPLEGAKGEPRNALRHPDDMKWDTAQTPASIAKLASEPRDLALRDMKNFRERGNSGSRPSFAYGFWYWHRLTRPVAALVLLMCCVAIMQRTGRQDGGDKALIIGMVFGFLFLVFDGAMATFATSGNMGVSLAIALPLMVTGLIGAIMLLRTETLTSKLI